MALLSTRVVTIIFALFLFFFSPVWTGLEGVAHVSEAAKYVGSENDLKAAFVFHFTKFVTWPSKKKKDQKEIVVGVLAHGDLLQALKALDGRKSIDKIIRIKPLDKLPPDSELNVLFLQKDFPCDKANLIEYAVKNHILTISDDKYSTDDGIVISIYKREAKIRFDINLKIARKSNLALSSKLLKLAGRVVR